MSDIWRKERMMSNMNIPKSLEVDFPCEHCKECINADYILEPKYVSFDGIEQFRITCKHAEICPEWEVIVEREKTKTQKFYTHEEVFWEDKDESNNSAE